ncbi:MAG: hypothetical protein DYG89_19890 [Caldilinea sp. CFX5]|nr:hypothetical protein [Caldilinea sp. CFX5]
MPNHKTLLVALEHFLIEWERAEIDRQFAAMAADDEYRILNEQLMESFAAADWEALQLAEQMLALSTHNTKLE